MKMDIFYMVVVILGLCAGVLAGVLLGAKSSHGGAWIEKIEAQRQHLTSPSFDSTREMQDLLKKRAVRPPNDQAHLPLWSAAE